MDTNRMLAAAQRGTGEPGKNSSSDPTSTNRKLMTAKMGTGDFGRPSEQDPMSSNRMFVTSQNCMESTTRRHERFDSFPIGAGVHQDNYENATQYESDTAPNYLVSNQN